MALLGVATLLRLWVIGAGLPLTLHYDEVHYVPKAYVMGSGDLNPHYWFNPPFFTYCLLAVYTGWYAVWSFLGLFQSTLDMKVLFHTDPTSFFILGRLTSLAFGIGTIFLVFKLAQKLYGDGAAFVAATFLSVNTLHTYYSQRAVSDVPSTFLVLAAIYCCDRHLRLAQARWLLLAAFLGGLSISTKYTCGYVVAAIGAALILGLAGEQRRLTLLLSRGWWCFVCGAMGVIAGNPYGLVDPTFLESFIRLKAFYDEAMFIQESATSAFSFYVSSMSAEMGWLIMMFSVLGAVVVFGRRSLTEWVMLAFVVVHFTYMCKQRCFAERFVLPVFPVLAVFAGGALARCCEALGMRGRVRATALVLLACLCVLQPLYVLADQKQALSERDTRTLMSKWVEENIPSGAKLACDILSNYNLSFTDLEVSGKDARIVVQRKLAHHGGKVYDIAEFGVEGIAQNPLSYYKRNGFEYLVLNSVIREAYEKRKDEFPKRLELYRHLEAECELVQEFRSAHGRHRNIEGCLISPTIWIYRLP